MLFRSDVFFLFSFFLLFLLCFFPIFILSFLPFLFFYFLPCSSLPFSFVSFSYLIPSYLPCLIFSISPFLFFFFFSFYSSGSLIWEVLADPFATPQNTTSVVSLVPILLPNYSNRNSYNNSNSNSNSNKNSDTTHTKQQHDTNNSSIKCGLISALENGIITIWDLSTLIMRPFESKRVPTCLYRLCLHEHPAGCIQKLIGKILFFHLLYSFFSPSFFLQFLFISFFFSF